MIEKSTVIVTSLGRTGTRFFSTFLGQVIPDSCSLHEPDVFQVVLPRHTYGSALRESLRRIVTKVRAVGVQYLLIRKALRRWSLVEVSDARVRGRLTCEQAVQRVLSQRELFVRTRPGLVYVESSIGYYGLIDLLSGVYAHHKLVYLVRDATDWVRSWMNWGEMYGKSGPRRLFAHTWPTAVEIKGDPYAEKWRTMSRFERICWAWATLNSYALNTIRKNPRARVFRFEDLFKSENRYQHLTELVDFVTGLPGVRVVPPQVLEGWLERRVHASSGDFPGWHEWSPEHKRQFTGICGPLMEGLDYELH